MTILKRLLNWKEEPSNVFILAIPLAVMGAFSALMFAILQWAENSDPWYFVILLAGIALFTIPAVQLTKRIKALRQG